jgi:hypothetical protein
MVAYFYLKLTGRVQLAGGGGLVAFTIQPLKTQWRGLPN